MRVLGPVATMLLFLACGTFDDDIAAPTIDPEKQAEIDRLNGVLEDFRQIKVELSEIGEGQGIAGPETFGRTASYSVTFRNPTPRSHLVVYSVHWVATNFIPTESGVCSDWLNKIRAEWPDEPPRAELLQPFSSVVKPHQSSALPDCFAVDPATATVRIDDIDGFESGEIQYRIDELEGREVEY